MNKRKIQIGIIGPEAKNLPKNKVLSADVLAIAEKIGSGIAENGAVLITGGCSGVVEAACKGAYKKGGVVVGTPGRNRGASVKWVTVEICTPIDVGDFVFAGVLSCDAIIVIPGDAGTLAELAIAYRNKKPLISIRKFGGDILRELKLNRLEDYPYYIVNSADEAVELAMKLAN